MLSPRVGMDDAINRWNLMSENHERMSLKEALSRLVTMDCSGLHQRLWDTSQQSSEALKACLERISKMAFGGESSE